MSHTRDTHRSALYGAEQLARHMFDQTGQVQIAGAIITLTQDARFGTLGSVSTYVNSVLNMPAVREQWKRAFLPVSVRARKGTSKAHYNRLHQEIAVPVVRGGEWAMRELVLLHELAHHLDNSGGASHGKGFTRTYADLVATVLGPEAGFVLTVLFSEAELL